MDKMLETATSLDGYALYPDAGEVGELDTPLLPNGVPNDAPTVAPGCTPTTVPEPAPCIPKSLFATDTTLSSPPTVHRKRKPLFLRWRTGMTLVLSLVGAGVYTGLLVQGVDTLLEDGIGTLAAEAVFGSTHTVTVLAETTSETMEEKQPDTPAPALPETETASPPANESASPLPVTEVLARDLSSRSANGLGLINETPYTPDLSALADTDPVIDSYGALESIYGKDCPAVLILHTHGTEAFADQADVGYHTADKDRSILQVGKALADVLTKNGIGVIHCTELFDEESFDMAYYNAARTIRETLEEHPSIRYILDIHRDAITNADGIGIRPLSVENDTEYAQLMFVVGTDHGGSGHTEWETNLALAARLQSSIHADHPSLMRDINLRSASFNAQYAPGALLIEAGAACSSLEEAVRSIEILGEAMAEEILR